MNETTLDLADVQMRERMLPEMYRCWAGELSVDHYRQYLREVDGHPWARRQIRPFVLRDRGGHPLSSLYLHAVRASHFDEEFWLGGIARVLTPGALRGRGYARELLQRTVELLRSEGVAGAYLFSDIDPQFYEPYGFQTVDRHRVDVPIGNLPVVDGPFDVRSLERPDDWRTIHRIHSEMAKGEALWLLREPEHWDYLLSREYVRDSLCPEDAFEPLEVLLLSGDEVIGYGLARARGERLELLEFGMRSVEADLCDCLLAYLRREGTARGCSRFHSPWPPGRWGSLFESRFERAKRQEGILMLASLSPKLDVDAIAQGSSGSWQTDHI